MSAQTMTEAVVLRIPRKDFWAFVARRPNVAMEIVGALARRLNSEYNRMIDLIGEQVEPRIVHSLYTLAGKFGPNLTLKREELANIAGTTTETAIRVLSKLRKKGIVSGSAARGTIVIVDIDKLKNYQ
jgi:CRP-like cAMP-binding protein